LVCVEADKDLSRLVQANLELNNLNFNATIINAAVVGRTSGVEHTLFAHSADNTVGHLSDARSGDSVSKVLAITFDDIVQQASFDRYALVCDIEGAEWDVFRRSAELAKCSLLIVELHKVEHDPNRSDFNSLLIALRQSFGLEVTDCYGPVFVLKKFS
jgi:FkbM family methyltransferase